MAYLAELFESYSIGRVNAIQSLIIWIGIWALEIVSRTGTRLLEPKAITWGDIDCDNRETTIKTAKGREHEIQERHVLFIGGVGEIYKQLRTELSDR